MASSQDSANKCTILFLTYLYHIALNISTRFPDEWMEKYDSIHCDVINIAKEQCYAFC